MATSYKVLGQSNPAASTNTTLYTVPASTQTVVSTITICNLAASTAIFNIAVRPAGATLSNVHYIAYQVTLGASDTTALSLGLTLSATDVITVNASTTSVSFAAFGSEIS